MATRSNKTVLLIRNVAPDDFGGAETYPVSLAQILIAKEWHPVIISKSQRLRDYAEKNQIESIKGHWLNHQNWSGLRIFLVPLFIAWQLYLTLWYISLIKKTQAQTLHIQSRDDFIAGSVAGRIMGCSVIWTDHMDLRYALMNIARPLRNPVGKLVFWAARFANRIILISKNEYTLVTAQFKKPQDLHDKIVIIKNGVIDKLSGMPGYTKNRAFTFCLASRIVKNKGIGEAIDAFKQFSDNIQDVNAKLHIYGNGADLEKFKSLAADNQNIVFFGHTLNAVRSMYESDVFILPSYQEGFSIALLEATMLGKTIIASSVDSNPEIIEDRTTGLLVPPKDYVSLAEAMQYLYENPEECKKYGSAARARYIEEFNLESIVENKILPLY